MFNMTLGKKTQSQPEPDMSQPPELDTMEDHQSKKSTASESQPSEDLNPDLSTSSLETNSEPDHFDDLIGSEEQAEQEKEKAQISVKMLDKEQFRQSFIGLHGMASAMSGIKALALPNSHIQTATANEIADTFYETILDVPMLHFLLMPGNKWLGRGLMMVVYVQGMRGAIGAELGAKSKENPKANFNDLKKASKGEGALTPDQASALTGV